MAHYSEMDFLFNTTNSQKVTRIIDNTSSGNIINIFKNDSDINKYVVYKNGTGLKSKAGTENIKNYLRDKIYKDSSKNPYIQLIDDFSAKQGSENAGLRLRAVDFAYLRDLGVYPINRMAILRRFPEGCMVPEDLSEMKLEPISTIVGWIKPEDKFGDITFNETWTTTNKRFDQKIAEMVKNITGVDIATLVPIPEYAQAILYEFYNAAGLTGNNNPNSINEGIETFNGISQGKDVGGDWGLFNIPVGNPNVLQEGPFRDPLVQNIKSDLKFELTTVYEQKMLGEVDPGSAMLDILDNIYAMGTSNMMFYWNDSSKRISDATKDALSDTANSPHNWWIFVKSYVVSFWEGLKKLFSDIKAEVKALYDLYKKEGVTQESLVEGIVPLALDAVKTILTSTIAIHRFELRGSMELMMGGKYSTTPWYLTLGNPYSPWISTNHIKVTSCSIETSTEMGFNDQPQSLTAKFNCEFSRALGKQELMRMFNNTFKRTYSVPLPNVLTNSSVTGSASIEKLQPKALTQIPVLPSVKTLAPSTNNSNFDVPEPDWMSKMKNRLSGG